MTTDNTIHLRHFAVRRSGGGMTVTGKDTAGIEQKFTEVVQIYSDENNHYGGRPFFFATKGGHRVELGA
ncbi:hypothetical protein GCM10017620_26230 [Brevundimonas intermedia]|uniref:Uncharacterized protein n=1 Tax=Brevundimonas intermedia TaxID=74315 RepID=A0ABQ5TBY8_9CAUL|nr:hypothetical protein [Brevundimonas intermedia]GLK49650.1 hypothetical protein GCM10017620_26230 [Brevundimonas intermedia]